MSFQKFLEKLNPNSGVAEERIKEGKMGAMTTKQK